MADSNKTTFAFAPTQPLPLAERPRRAVSWRSALIGTLLCGLLCALLPYNDYVIENSIAIGSYLPLVLVLAFFILVVLVNAPLHRWAPRSALSHGELAVIMAMLLVACAVPAQGMMRTLIPNMIAPHYLSKGDPKFEKVLQGMGLPAWLSPVHDKDDPLIRDFYSSVPAGQKPRYAPWITPLIGWGVFAAGLMTALVSAAIVIAPQWSRNERLAFPIAQLQQALIEPPEKGRALNETFRSRLFWIALVFVLVLHLIAGGNLYLPRYIPKLELKYDFRSIFTEEPWTYFSDSVKTARFFFTFIGITYFIPGRLSFSLWSIFLIFEVVNVGFKMHQAPIEQPAMFDEEFGASVAFVLGVLWVGRAQWISAVKQMFGREKPREGRSLRWPTVAFIAGIATMLVWLHLVGVQAWVAVLIVGVLLLVHLITARVVAETGIPTMRMFTSPLLLMSNVPPTVLTGPDVFMGGMFYMQGPLATRESLLTYATHGLRVGSEDDSARVGRGVIALLVWALAFSFVVSAASWLWTYYHYSMPLTWRHELVNNLSLQDWPKSNVVDPVLQWSDKRVPVRAHTPAVHMGVGFGITALLQFASLRWAAWPFAPIGFLMCQNMYIRQAWFSIFLGWLAKMLIVQFGGAKMFQQARPAFYGMVFGESLAAVIWMVLNFILAAGGHEYQFMQLLPQ